MMVALTAASIVAGNLITRTGRYKHFIVVGPVLTLAGMFMLSRLGVQSTAADVWPWMVVIGLGMGMFFPTITTLTQNALDIADLGAGTSTLTFFRSLGQTVGVGVFGAVLASRVESVLNDLLPSGTAVDVDRLLSTPAEIRALPAELESVVVEAVADATTLVFLVATPVVAGVLIATSLIPERPLRAWSALAAGTQSTEPASTDDAPAPTGEAAPANEAAPTNPAPAAD
jgi:MFS family permease